MERKLTRREILKLGLGSAAAFSLVSLSGCAGVQRRDLPRFESPSAVLPSDLRRMLYLASLAPSSHNTQPWRVRLVDERSLQLRIDPARCLNVVDPKRREMLLSMGAFIENVAQAAAGLGYLLTVNEVADTALADPLCRLTLSPATKQAVNFAAIEGRRTLRGGLTGGAQAEAACRDLAELGACLRFVPIASDDGRFIGKLVATHFANQTNDDAAQAELAEWIRLKRVAAEAQRDGLTAESLEITGFSGWIARTFMNDGSVMKPMFRKSGIDNTNDLVHEGAGWFILDSRSDSVGDCLAAGRAFERLALRAYEKNIALHPMSQPLEYPRPRGLLADRLGLRGLPQFVLRAGAVKSWPVPVSLRRPVSAFLDAD